MDSHVQRAWVLWVLATVIMICAVLGVQADRFAYGTSDELPPPDAYHLPAAVGTEQHLAARATPPSYMRLQGSHLRFTPSFTPFSTLSFTPSYMRLRGSHPTLHTILHTIVHTDTRIHNGRAQCTYADDGSVLVRRL
jgi:hypothetical protein